MKKLLALLLVLVICVGALASCDVPEFMQPALNVIQPAIDFVTGIINPGEDTPEEDAGLADAATYLYNLYKDGEGKATPKDFDVVGKVVIDGVAYEVTWTSDNAKVVIKASAKEGFWTVDVPDANDAEFSYKLTATVKSGEQTATKTFGRVVPVVDNTGIVTVPEVGVAYKFFMDHTLNGQKLYATHKIVSDKYYATTNNPAEAPDFFVEADGEGFKFYTMIDGAKKYVEAYLGGTDNTSKRLRYSDNGTTWIYDPECGTGAWTANISNTMYMIGSYGTFDTFCISETSHADSENQYFATFMTSAYAETLKPDEGVKKDIPQMEGATQPVVGSKYVLGFVHGGLENKVLYMTGALSGYYMNSTEDVTKAANFYVEAVDGGYNIYAIAAGAKVYLNVVPSGSYINAKYETAASTVYVWDAELKTLKTTLDGTEYIFGTSIANTYKTLGPVKNDGNAYYAQFVASTNADQEAPETPDTPEEPQPPIGDVEGTELTSESLGLGNTYAPGTATVDGVEFEWIQLGDFGDGIQMRDKENVASMIWNTTAFGAKIEKIVLVFSDSKNTYDNDDAVIFTFGNAADGADYTTKLTTSEGTKTYVITPEGDFTFFKMEHDLGFTMYWKSITIVLGEAVHEHDFSIPATCTEPAKCECGETSGEALGHDKVVDVAAVEPDCTNAGNTEGSHCSRCDAQTVVSQPIAPLGHTAPNAEQNCDRCGASLATHTHVYTILATCTEPAKCECGEADPNQPALGHTETAIDAVAPTCTATGLTAGVKCSVCDVVLTAQEEVAATGHTEEAVDAVAPTCTATGLTAGVKCSVCDVVLTAQEEVAALGHTFSNGSCSVCGATDPEYSFTNITVTQAATLDDGIQVVIANAIICRIDEAYNSQYGNITVTITDGTTELKVYRLKAESADSFKLGDIITVTGTMATYSSARQIAAGATATVTGHDNSYDYVEVSIADAIAAPDGTNVIISGVVTQIGTAYSEQYKNISVYITDGTTTIYLYRLKGNVSVNDIITVNGAMATYNGERQVTGGTFEKTGTHTCSEFTAATCESKGKCVLCGAANPNGVLLDHTIVNGTCTVCGYTEGVVETVYTLSAEMADGSVYYWDGTAASGKGALTTDAASAAKLYIKEVEGGVHVYIKDASGAKKYITIGTSNTGFSIKDAEAVLQYDASTGYIYNGEGEDARYLATYGVQDLRTYKASNIPGNSGANAYMVIKAA